MNSSAINSLIALNPAIEAAPIRIDKDTQMASVIDVVKLVTGKDNNEAALTVRRLDLGK